MKKHFSMFFLTGCCTALLLLGCNQQQKPAPDTRVADEAAIREADIAWSTVAEAKQIDMFKSYFLDDCVLLGPNEPMAIGKDAIHKMIDGMFGMPGFSVKWQPTKVEAARSGDFGYSLGTYEMTYNDPKGKLMTDQGKYATVWKKQTEGSWKAALDMFNSDLPLPQPPSK